MIESKKYKLQSFYTKNIFEDTGWLLSEPKTETPSLIRAIYKEKQLKLKPSSLGLYQFSDWMPIERIIEGSSAPVTYKSEGLAKYLNLSNLYITFSGWWPEIGAKMSTCSFKETEAYTVCGRLSGAFKEKVLVVASAGNTARSFAKVCSDNNIPLLLCMPLDNIDALWFDKPLNPCVKLVCTPKGSDYYDAIHLSEQICKDDFFLVEGGAKNIARRDGMSTTMLSAVTHIGKLPEYYFQAVGSGTGAIAAWEANLRFIEDGRFGSHKTKLMLSQNAPFLPMYNAWKQKSRVIPELDHEQAKAEISEIYSKVLSNRKPPYGIHGGLFDALVDTKGEIFAIDNKEAINAANIFEEYEGIDIHSAASVAVASLINAVKDKLVNKDSFIVINITGGGEKKFRKGKKEIFYTKPNLIESEEYNIEKIINTLKLDFNNL